MSDVLARLMLWMETSDIDDADVVLRDAITEIAGLRARLHEHRLASPRIAERDATLTDAEAKALRFALGRLSGTLRGIEECDHYDTLSGLLVRFK